MLRRLVQKVLLGLVVFLGVLATCAEDKPPHNVNLQLPTLGGNQFWADELFFHQWRIQRNVLTDHYRLLDRGNRRHAWGTFVQCQNALERIKLQKRLPPMRGRAVITLHGLGASRRMMNALGDYLRVQGNLQVFNVSYPSTRCSVAEHAQTLARLINGLEGIDEIDFVAHSLGNIVVRHYLQDVSGPLPKRPRFRRMVMIGAPNHGSLLASHFSENKVYQTVGGKSAEQLGHDWGQLQGKLATPDFEFAVIAGGKGDGKGYNPLLPGDNDGIITVRNTRLRGARDFAVVPVLHPLLPHDKRVQQQTLQFLQKGFFRTEKKRQPIE